MQALGFIRAPDGSRSAARRLRSDERRPERADTQRGDGTRGKVSVS